MLSIVKQECTYQDFQCYSNKKKKRKNLKWNKIIIILITIMNKENKEIDILSILIERNTIKNSKGKSFKIRMVKYSNGKQLAK